MADDEGKTDFLLFEKENAMIRLCDRQIFLISKSKERSYTQHDARQWYESDINSK